MKKYIVVSNIEKDITGISILDDEIEAICAYELQVETDEDTNIVNIEIDEHGNLTEESIKEINNFIKQHVDENYDLSGYLDQYLL